MSGAQTSADRALALLDLFGGSAPPVRGLSELAAAAGQNKATCYRGLQALCRAGLLAREGDGYRLGFRLVELTERLKAGVHAHRVAVPYMEHLSDRTGQSVQFVVRDRDQAVYLEVVQGTTPVRLYIRPGRRAPLFAGASTRLLLSFLPASERDAILRTNPPRRFTEHTILDRAEFEGRVEETRRTWFAISFGELEPGTAEAAAPVMGPQGEPLAALSVAGMAQPFLDGGERARILGELDASAQAISRRVGYRGIWSADLQAFLRDVAARLEPMLDAGRV